MTVLQIGVLSVVAGVIGRLPRARLLAILVASTLVAFWLQPVQSPMWLQFWIPTATIALCVLVWALTAPREARSVRRNWGAAAILVAAILMADLNRYFKLSDLFLVETPRLRYVVLAVSIMCIVAVALAVRRRPLAFLWTAAFAGIVLLLVALKLPSWTDRVLGAAVGLGRQATTSAVDLGAQAVSSGVEWLGFSYLAFRLLHVIQDRRSGRLPALNLGEFAAYALFFPSFTSGPIDRAERFVVELRTPLPLLSREWLGSGGRILLGMLKKFVIADTLAVFSLSETLAGQVRGTGWLWLLLYAYALRIFFDFSGYTDIAIGMGRLMGVQLPENFVSPYLRSNLTLFWNSWHITLTQWFRSYFFNPVVRALRRSASWAPAWTVILLAQLGTMLLIGMWHGIAWSYAAWGAWHGFGLFLHNRWVALVGSRLPKWAQSGLGQGILRGAGVVITFNYVAIGWLFFSFSSPAAAYTTLLRLFGIG